MPKKQTSAAVSKIAAKGLARPQSLTAEEVRQVCASVLGQDETKGN